MLATAVRTTLAAILVAMVALIAAPAHAAASAIDATFTVSEGQVRIVGTLTSEGDAVKRERVVATLDGAETASASTLGNGGFELSFALPADLSAGDHVVAVRFAGAAKVDPSRSQITITVAGSSDGGGGGGSADPGSDDGGSTDDDAAKPHTDKAPATPKEAPPAALTLTATSTEEALNGSVVDVTGTLVTADGTGIADAGISVADAGGEVEDSFTLTTSTGSFQTLYAIPADQPTGDLTLTISFPGTARLAAASTQLTIAVEHTEVATATPSPSASPSPTASPSATADGSSTASPAATGGTTATPDSGVGTAMTWFLAASVVAGGGALLTLAVLVFRGSRGAALLPDEEGNAIDFLDDELSLGDTSVLTGLSALDLADDEPTQRVRPARAMPEDD